MPRNRYFVITSEGKLPTTPHPNKWKVQQEYLDLKQKWDKHEWVFVHAKYELVNGLVKLHSVQEAITFKNFLLI